MNIHLVSLNESELLGLLLNRARYTAHTLVDDPAAADLILLAGSFGTDPDLLLQHPLYIASPNRCAVYTEDDNYLPLAPGVYCSAQADRNSRVGRTFSYSYVSRDGRYSNPFVAAPEVSTAQASVTEPRRKSLLFSFQGGSTSLLRKRIFNLNFGRPDILIENTSTYYHWDLHQPGREDRQLRYAQTLASSHFVLCPRGAGTGSIRFFETMSAGIAPVLLSDDYLLPTGPSWGDFLLRIPERDIAKLPHLLEPHVASSSERGRLARQAWVAHFAPEQEFDAIVARCWAALHHGPPTEAVFRAQQIRIVTRSRAHRAVRSFARSLILKTLKVLHIKSPYQLNR